MEGGDPENPVNYYFLLENIFLQINLINFRESSV
jgi:hypothetical protein